MGPKYPFFPQRLKKAHSLVEPISPSSPFLRVPLFLSSLSFLVPLYLIPPVHPDLYLGKKTQIGRPNDATTRTRKTRRCASPTPSTPLCSKTGVVAVFEQLSYLGEGVQDSKYGWVERQSKIGKTLPSVWPLK